MKYPQLVSMPSAVSDWLEEQLEARGIDAVVYTRYILSLLHSDTLDVIYSEEDFHFSHLKKEVRRSGGNRKRCRRSSDWWKYAQADADKLKRSAAVECLMSVAEQTCGIESLIDELCAKLNEVNVDSSATEEEEAYPPSKKLTTPEHQQQQVSPQEQAKRYYAAFPPLNRNNTTSTTTTSSTTSPTQSITLLPKWLPSPKKKPSLPLTNNNNHSANHKILHHYPFNCSNSYDDKMKTNRSTIPKQRFDVYLSGRTINRKEGLNLPYKANIRYEPVENSTIKKSRMESSTANVNELEPQHDYVLPEDWTMSEDLNLYDDLPVDIKELLDDNPPPSQDVTVAMMNLANMRDTGKRTFLPCGTNITSSIWTDEAAMEYDNTLNNGVLDIQFSSFSLGNSAGRRDGWADKKSWEVPKWSDGFSACIDDENMIVNQLKQSLCKLRHHKDLSAFAEVFPKKRTIRHSRHCFNNPFSKIVGSGIFFHREAITEINDADKDKDDLLTSVKSHFRPINEKVDGHVQGQYADGATFVVTNTWDKINYKRTESGAMYLESDYGMRKKYYEYKMKNGPRNMEFILKYLVCQNDKGCQTEDVDAEVAAINLERQNVKNKSTLNECTCRTLATKTDFSTGECLAHSSEQGNVGASGTGGTVSTIVPKLLWEQGRSCDKCNKGISSIWNDVGQREDGLNAVGWEFGAMSKIWSGDEVCHSCLENHPSTLQHSKLREDVSQDGDQLLSDLRTIQKTYMQETTSHFNLPLAELSCDISELLLPKEQRKRRHSLLAVGTNTSPDDWSFASRLEEDCLIQMSALPTLRSVTL